MNENFRKSASQKKFIELEVFNDESIEKFQNEIANLEMHNQLDANINKNPNDNYKIVSTLLQTAKNKHIPKRIVKFNKRRHKKERWMTNELLAKIVIKNEMYVDWKTTPVTSEHFERVKLRFKGYEKLVLKEIEIAKREYFGRVFAAYRSDIKKTWQVISETLSRNIKKAELPSKFVHEGREIEDPTEIANAFNIYFAHIGKNLSSTIEQDDTNADYKQYLNSPTAEKLQFKCIDEKYTIKALDNLENKNSSLHDGISNKLLKSIQYSVSKSLTIIINQMITTGIFPDAFKVSKVMPIFKKGDCSLMSNYRPISLLPTISKIF